MGAPEVSWFLTFFASQRKVSASTESRALSALLFFYKNVLNKEIGLISDSIELKSQSVFRLFLKGSAPKS